MTRGALALFRGDIGIDCSNSEAAHGAPVFHTLDWNNLYFIGEKGYCGLYDLSYKLETEGKDPPDNISFLGLDTINRISAHLTQSQNNQKTI